MRHSGKVKWFNPTKGFGFIVPSDGGSDVFVHITDVKKAGLAGLTEGAGVSYELAQDGRTGKMTAQQLEVPNG